MTSILEKIEPIKGPVGVYIRDRRLPELIESYWLYFSNEKTKYKTEGIKSLIETNIMAHDAVSFKKIDRRSHIFRGILYPVNQKDNSSTLNGREL